MKDSNPYPISWLEIDKNVLIKRPKNKIFLGVCHYAKKVCKFSSDMFTMILVRDCYIDESKNECEE